MVVAMVGDDRCRLTAADNRLNEDRSVGQGQGSNGLSERSPVSAARLITTSLP